jgi:Ca-activated chloride channel family protein
MALILAAIPVSRLFRDALTLKTPLGPPGGAAFRPPFRLEFAVTFFRALEYAGVFLLILAAAGPRLLIPELVWLDRGADIFFVLDISPSMAALDMNGKSRFDAARAFCAEFARNRPSDAIGLAALGNEAALLLPPTIDRDLFQERLEQLQIGELGDGTALGLGLATAALHLRNSTAPRRAVVLVTDGENNAGAVHPETAAAALRESGVSLWIIGAGSSGEIPIDYVDPVTKIRRRGILESRFNAESLRAIARQGGGTYIAAPSAAAFQSAFDRVDDAELSVRRTATVRTGRSLQTQALIAALACLFLARFLRRIWLGALF